MANALVATTSVKPVFAVQLLWKICRIFDEQDIFDTTLKVSNPTVLIPAHRVILAAASPYFRELFKAFGRISPPIRQLRHVTSSEEFLDFDSKKLQKLIESDKLNVRSESDVFEAVKRWYEHDACARKQHLPDLVGCLRLSQFNADFIMKNIHSLPGCNIIALEALTWLSHPSTRSELTLKYTKEREGQITKPEKSLMALHIENGTIYKHNKSKDGWETYAKIELDVMGFGVTIMDENLIFTGGVRNNIVLNEVRSWNFKTKTFKQLRPMNEGRYHHSVAILNKKMYAIGGLTRGDTKLESVEMYTDSDGWKYAKETIIPRYSAAAVAFNNKIYVMGGYSYIKLPLGSVECYDPIKNFWSKCADMGATHDNPTAIVHNEQILVLGRGRQTSSMVMERYNQERKQNFNGPRINGLEIGFISIDNELWAVGGRGSHCTLVYDEQSEKWNYMARIPLPGPFYCFSVPTALIT